MNSTIEILKQLATEQKLQAYQVNNTIKLLVDEECTVPFIARYRKEMTGSMDEVQIRDLRDRYYYLVELETNKEKYLKVVEEFCQKNPAYAGKFPELKTKFINCKSKQELEDLYLPFKPKRRTKAQVAREKGLEPLLEAILNQRASLKDILPLCDQYVTKTEDNLDPALRVPSAEAALQGAGDILAERISEMADLRAAVRTISMDSGVLVSKKIDSAESSTRSSDQNDPGSTQLSKASGKGKKGEAHKYENYFDFRESVKSCPSHRIMAIRRGETEKILRVSIEVDSERILSEITKSIVGSADTAPAVSAWMTQIVEESYRRLIATSIESEIRLELKNRAEADSIKVFTKNLENLLLLPPIPQKIVMGVDPGIRTGSKIAVVNETGALLFHTTVYPDFKPDVTLDTPKTKQTKDIIVNTIKAHKVQYIAIGNGTASRELDRLIRETLKESKITDVKRLVVNESGASVYSADEIAREEFPTLDATIRSAISIARRLQDPLAELVKIDPRSIGVGQYQHDVNVTKLKLSLEEVVESCVNKVGVNLNTASYKLLGYVSGIGGSLAKAIVQHRDKKGRFISRADILKVPGFGPKAFEQAAGFLRVPESKNPLDNSAVHPERYAIIEQIAKDLGSSISDLVGKKTAVEAIAFEKYVSDDLGLPTLRDIASELVKPGRDPREDGIRLTYSDDVAEIEDLRPGMTLQGTVTNVTNFGAFVDIGVHQDGLIHISELSDQFVTDPASVVAVGDILSVRVLDVDKLKKRISLSAKTPSKSTVARTSPMTTASNAQSIRSSQKTENPRPQNRNLPPPTPDKKHSMDDLLSKFGRR
jgi:protein Tex